MIAVTKQSDIYFACMHSAATTLLIDTVHENMYDGHDEKLTCHSGMWRRVEDVTKLNGCSFTPEQLRGRWKTLVSSH